MDDIVLSDDVVIPAVVLAQYSPIFPGDEAAEPFQGGVEGNNGIGLFQHFSDLFPLNVLSIAHHTDKEPAFTNGADDFVLLYDGQVFHIIFLHQLEGLCHGLPGGHRDQTFGSPARYDVLESLHIQETSFYHPLIVVDLTHIPAAVIVEDHHH